MRLKDIHEDVDIKQKTVAEYLDVKQNTYSRSHHFFILKINFPVPR